MIILIPDNYRTIAILASNMEKIFASTLLRQLITFRSLTDPDSHNLNRLGFCMNVQTSDHIFTLTTCLICEDVQDGFICALLITQKLSTQFVWELLYKLQKMGFQGKFFRCTEF